MPGTQPDLAHQKQQMRRLFDDVAEAYPAAEFFPQFARSLVRWSQLPRGARVLDLAAGRGAIFDNVAAAAAPACAVAVDLSGRMISLLRSSHLESRGNLGFAVMDAETLAFADASFDAVLCGFALNMMPDPHQALLEIYRILRPGGIFSASVPGPALSNPFPPYSALIARFSQLTDPARWTMSDLPHPERLLIAAGFADVLRIHDETPMRVHDPAEFWKIEMAHGLRGFYQSLPGYAQQEFYRQFLQVVAPPQGRSLLIGRGAIFFRGRKPEPAPGGADG